MRSSATLPPAVRRIQDLVQEGLGLQRAQRQAEAAERYTQALSLDPGCFDALQLLGVLRFRSGDVQAGIELLTRALALHPNHAPTLNNLGNALRIAGRLPEAALAYQRAVRADPNPAPIMLCNLGSALLSLGDPAQAGPLLRQAVVRAPDNALIHCWLGHHARAEHRPEQSLPHYQAALRLDPGHAEALRGLGSALRDLERPAEAVPAFDQALAVQPDYVLARISRAEARLAAADWSGFEPDVHWIERLTPTPGDMIDAVKPLCFTDDPQVLRRYAEALAIRQGKLEAGAGPPRVQRHPAAPLRIGYLSTDLRDHPVGRLLAAVLERHDRSAIDLQLFSIGPRDESDVRRRIEAVARPVELGGLSDTAVLARLRAAQLDLLVDLVGYTYGHRARVLATRAAPVQACWLGFHGTLGGTVADYLIADHFSIAPGTEDAYSERLVRLPGCVLPGDTARSVSAPLPRSEYGLPEDAVVLAAFAQTRKLNPRVFGIWLEVLRAVPEAVLWLSAARTPIPENLRTAAAAQGVDPQRLVFAPRVADSAAHLARYRAADLALDTYPYGLHSSALDALWAGCPLVTWAGRSFAARVSSSAVRAAGLPELVAATGAEYGALVSSLARDREGLAALRARLDARRDACGLFDAVRFTRALERAYAQMIDRSRRGLPPAHLWID